jgi:uncharacterized membrane protein
LGSLCERFSNNVTLKEIVMSSTFVVVSFADERKAYEGVRALKALHSEGSLTLYGYAVVQRGAEQLSVKQADSEFPIGTGLGALVGGLVGALGGPVGAVVGLSAGTSLGALRDLWNLGVSDEFLDNVAKQLTPGKTAVVAEVGEEWVTPLNTQMESIGGNIVRELRDDFVEDELQRRIEQRKTEVAQRRTELAAAHAEKREAVKKQLQEAEQRLRNAASTASERVKRYGDETAAKLRALQDQAKRANTEARGRIDTRMQEIRADQAQRASKLKQAGNLIQEALRP